jgi:hypothetical protein
LVGAPVYDPCTLELGFEVVISRVDVPGPSLTPATHASSIALTRRSMSHFSTAFDRPRSARMAHMRLTLRKKSCDAGLKTAFGSLPPSQKCVKFLAADVQPWARSSLQ